MLKNKNIMKFNFCHPSFNVVLLKSIIVSLLILPKHNGAYAIQEFSSYSYYDKKLHRLQNLSNDTVNFGASHKSNIRVHGDHCDNHNFK